MKNRYLVLLSFCLVFLINPSNSLSQSIPYSGGRIIISADGNEHDNDDWAATALSLALLASQGLQDSLVVYTFSDHIWGSNNDIIQGKGQGKEQMLISVNEGKEWFGFSKTKFIEAVGDSSAAFNAIAEEIDRSDAANPLTIIAAGPMHVVGSGISKADANKLKYVRLISHSWWNDFHADRPENDWDQHSGWTWKEIENQFKGKGLICDHITDQNGGSDYDGLHAEIEKYDWIKNSPVKDQFPYKKGSWDWLYSRQLMVIKKNGTEFDPSDAGMVVYLLSGVQKTSPEDVRKLMENPLKRR